MVETRGWSVREAGPDDIAVLADFRRRMFTEMGARDPQRVERMAATFVPFAAQAMPHGDLRAWIAEANGRPFAGVAVVLQTMPPSLRNPEGRTGYILNLYVEPERRRGGVARTLVQNAIDALRESGVGAAVLHASEQGRPLYEKLGFEPSSEMRLFFDPDALDPYGHEPNR